MNCKIRKIRLIGIKNLEDALKFCFTTIQSDYIKGHACIEGNKVTLSFYTIHDLLTIQDIFEVRVFENSDCNEYFMNITNT